jgi:NADPH:quinone reductase-like Zn-dependent oxidoreductase
MKATVQDRYGSPGVLELREVDKPVAAGNEVLVRVHAAAVNAPAKVVITTIGRES